jgi:hypothetical protein
MPEPKSDHAAVMRFLAFLALAIGAVAMLTGAIAFGGGCAMAAAALLVLESVLAY